MKLAELVTFQPGYQFRGKVEPVPGSSHRIIQIKDIDDSAHRLRANDLASVVPERDPERYLLDKGDVLFVAKGRRNYATPVEEALKLTFPAGYFLILKPRVDGLLPEYLSWYMNQRPAQAYIKGAARGTGIPMIPRPALEALDVEVPTVAKQKAIVEADRLLAEEMRTLEDIARRRKELVSSICLKAARDRA